MARHTANTRADTGEMTAMVATAATDSTAATAIGNTARTSTSDSSSTDAPTRATRSPLRNRIATFTGPSASLRYSVSRVPAAARNAVWCDASRWQYPSTPREMPSARTATTATERSSTGGICQARVINHADTPARASALPSDSTPSAPASTSRGSRGRNRSRMDHTSDVQHPVPDGEHRITVADDQDGRPGPRPRDDGLQHPGLHPGIQVGGGLVE